MYYSKFIQLSDVIKVVDELAYTDYRDSVKKLNLKNQDRKFIANLITQLIITKHNNVIECFEKKALWAGLLHHIHYQPTTPETIEFVEAMRGKENKSVYSAFENAMAKGNIKEAINSLVAGKGNAALLRNLNYIISRCSSKKDIQCVIDSIRTDNNIVLMQLLLNYHNYNTTKVSRVFTYSKNNLLTTYRESQSDVERRKSLLSPYIIPSIINSIEGNLYDNMNGSLGRVYVAENMKNIALPIQENTANAGFGRLSKGSRIHIQEGKKIRAFTYWEKVDDIDLAVIGIDAYGNQTEFSWRTMYNKQSDAIAYSGDVTNGYNGGSEFFDVDINAIKKAYPHLKYLVFCDNVFSHVPFDKCFCKAGFMFRDIIDSGEIYEPKTVESSFIVDGNSTFAYLFAIDLTANDFVWLNISNDSDSHVAGCNDLSFVTKYFNICDVLNVYDFMCMLAGEVVSNPEDADVIVSDDAITVGNKAEVIRSYDFDKFFKLMNIKKESA